MNHFKEAVAYQIKYLKDTSFSADAETKKDLIIETLLQTIRDLYQIRFGSEPHHNTENTVAALEMSISADDILFLKEMEQTSRKRETFLELCKSSSMEMIRRIVSESERIFKSYSISE